MKANVRQMMENAAREVQEPKVQESEKQDSPVNEDDAANGGTNDDQQKRHMLTKLAMQLKEADERGAIGAPSGLPSVPSASSSLSPQRASLLPECPRDTEPSAVSPKAEHNERLESIEKTLKSISERLALEKVQTSEVATKSLSEEVTKLEVVSEKLLQGALMQREEIGQVMRALNDQVCLIQLQLEALSKKMHGGDGTMSEACLEELQKLRKDVRLIQEWHSINSQIEGIPVPYYIFVALFAIVGVFLRVIWSTNS